MRVPTTQTYLQGIEAFSQQQVKLAKLQQQISTGVRLTNPSDDPVASSQVLGLSETIALQKQYQENISAAENRLQLQETTLVSIESITFRLKELSIQANSSALDNTNRIAIGVEVEQRLDELVSLANTQDANGDFLFAGYQSAIQPFTSTTTGSIPHVVYGGDEGTRSVQISESRQIQVDNPGSEIFLKLATKDGLSATAAVANTGSAAISPPYVFNTATYVPSNITITFTSATTYDVTDSSTPANDVVGATYASGTNIDVGGVRFVVTGTPALAGGDAFTVSGGQAINTALNENAALANTGNGTISPAQVFNAATYVPSNITITFTSATTYDVTDSSTPANDVIGAIYTPSTDIDVGGVRFSITGTPVGAALPAGGDVFSVSTGQYKDIFETVQVFADTLSGSIGGEQREANFAVFLDSLDGFFNRVLEVRTSIGGRLNSLESQKNANEADIIVTQATISTLRDTDLAEAISQLTLEQATLDAALAVFSRITSSSLFNYLK